MQAPVVPGEVNRAAAHEFSIHQVIAGLGVFLFGLAEGLLLLVIHQRTEGGLLVLVVREVAFVKKWSLLEDHYTESIGGKFFGEDAARGTRSDDDEIDSIRGAVFGLNDLAHFFSSAAACDCRSSAS